MSRRKKNYSVAFKKKALELSFARGSATQICKELDIPTSVPCRWRREPDQYGKNGFPGRGKPKLTDRQREIAELKKKSRDLELENRILKKVVSIFSASDRKNLGS